MPTNQKKKKKQPAKKYTYQPTNQPSNFQKGGGQGLSVITIMSLITYP